MRDKGAGLDENGGGGLYNTPVLARGLVELEIYEMPKSVMARWI